MDKADQAVTVPNAFWNLALDGASHLGHKTERQPGNNSKNENPSFVRNRGLYIHFVVSHYADWPNSSASSNLK